jgi:GAF domain-containing protein
MPMPTRFHKERALRAAGVPVQPYPLPTRADVEPQAVADRRFLDACAAWDAEIDRHYLQLTQQLPATLPSPEVQAFLDRCAGQGLKAALADLNGRVPHRYTALYRLEDAQLKNVELIDKAGELRPEFLASVPLTDSFCQFVLRDGAFLTEDSARDERLDGHPYKGVMVAYHGVPVIDGAGELFGSLCHFDVQVQPLSDAEFAHLQGVAQALARVMPGKAPTAP